MGGYAYLINGTVESRLIQEEPDGETLDGRKASLWQLLRGASRAANRRTGSRRPRVITTPKGHELYELHPGSLRAELVRDFRAWLESRIPKPLEATTIVLDYVRDIEPTVYLRGERRAGAALDEATFYVQISFSGCAGQAETSARVCAHWAASWYQDHRRRLTREYLVPSGFVPDAREPLDFERMYFLPARHLGYLEFIPEDSRYEGAAAFELDLAVAEAYDGGGTVSAWCFRA